MRTRQWMGAALAALMLSACGGGDDDSSTPATAADEAPQCADVYAAGRPTDDVIADHNSPAMVGGCLEGGAPLFVMATSFECTPTAGAPRTVHQADGFGWGFAGDTWQPAGSPEPYTDCVLAGTDAQHP